MKAIIPILAISLLTACGGIPGPYIQANQGKFVSLGPDAASAVSCTALQETAQNDGRLMVKANVQNRMNRRVHVQIRCVFKDKQGFSLEETPFQTLILTEYAQQTVPFESLKVGVENYTVQVRLTR